MRYRFLPLLLTLSWFCMLRHNFARRSGNGTTIKNGKCRPL